MINIIYAALPLRVQTEKTTFSCNPTKFFSHNSLTFFKSPLSWLLKNALDHRILAKFGQFSQKKKICFQKTFKIMNNLQQTVSNRGVGVSFDDAYEGGGGHAGDGIGCRGVGVSGGCGGGS